MNAGATLQNAAKNSIVSDASRKLSPKTIVASMPVGKLKLY